MRLEVDLLGFFLTDMSIHIISLKLLHLFDTLFVLFLSNATNDSSIRSGNSSPAIVSVRWQGKVLSVVSLANSMS